MSKLRVYLAGSSKEHARAKAIAALIEAMGCIVTDRWWEGAEAWAGQDHSHTDPVQRAIACKHRLAIRGSHVLWMLAPESPSAGASSELEHAICHGVATLVTGPHRRDSVYYALADERFVTDADGVGHIAELFARQVIDSCKSVSEVVAALESSARSVEALLAADGIGRDKVPQFAELEESVATLRSLAEVT